MNAIISATTSRRCGVNWRSSATKPPSRSTRFAAISSNGSRCAKRYIWWRNYDQAAERSERENTSRWYRTIPRRHRSRRDSRVDKFEIEVGEETSPHMILHNISPEIQARLARQMDRFFCLSLVPSKYRQYPFGRAACNVLGYLGTARPEEIVADADFTDAQVQERWIEQAMRLWPETSVDRYGVSTFRELRKYWPADLVGRAGIESLCENTLRGTTGQNRDGRRNRRHRRQNRRRLGQERAHLHRYPASTGHRE